MKRKSFIALALLPFGLCASTPMLNSEIAAVESIIAYSNQQSGSNLHNSRNQYNDQVQPRAQQPMEQEDRRYGVAVFGDYLYWKPYLSNAMYALLTNESQSGVIPADGKPKSTLTNENLSLKGDSGFRVGLSYKNEWNNIGVEGVYTRFFTSTTRTVSNNTLEEGLSDGALPDTIYPLWNTIGTSARGSIFYAQGTGLIHFQEIDLLFTTIYKASSWFTVTPGAGVRGLITKTELNALYEKNKWGNVIVFGPPFNTDATNITQKYDAVGAIGVIRTNFDIAWGISSFCDAAVSYVIGNKRVHNKIERIDLQESIQQDLYDYNTTGLAIFDLDLGLQYEWLNDAKNFGLLFQIAYEVHFLPEFFSPVYLTQQFGRIIAYKSDLTFQGLRVRGGISF